VIILGLYLLIGSANIDNLISDDVGGVIIIPRPIDLAIKLADSKIMEDFRQIQSTAPLFRLIDPLFIQKHKLGLATLVAPKIYVTFPKDIKDKLGGPPPFTTYIEIGRLLKFLSLAGIRQVIEDKMSPVEFRGHTIYVQDEQAITFLKGYVILGAEKDVQNVILTSLGEGKRLGEKLGPAKIRGDYLDDKSDIQFILSSKSFLEKGNNNKIIDPRILFDPSAFAAGYGNIHIDFDMISIESTLVHVPGKVLLPNTKETEKQFDIVKLAKDEHFLFGGVKLENPLAIIEPLINIMGTDATRESNLRKKLIAAALGPFFELVGPEVGIVLFSWTDRFPTLIFQLKDKQNVEIALTRMVLEMDKTGAKLAGVLGVKLKELLDDPDLTQELIDKLPVEAKGEAETLLAYWSANKPKHNQIRFFSKPMNYSIIDQILVMSPYEYMIEKIKLGSMTDGGAEEIFESLGGVDNNGSIIILFDFLELLKGLEGSLDETLLGILQKHNWKVSISAKGEIDKTQFKLSVPISVGIETTGVVISMVHKIIYYGVIFLALSVFIGAIYGFYKAVKSIILEYG